MPCGPRPFVVADQPGYSIGTLQIPFIDRCALQDLDRLTKLVVAVRDKGIKRLGSLTQLASLEIVTMTWTENEHLRSLQRLTGLRALTFTGFRGLKYEIPNLTTPACSAWYSIGTRAIEGPYKVGTRLKRGCLSAH